MRFHRFRIALVLLVASVLFGTSVSRADSSLSRQDSIESFVQPFLITFERHDSHVIALQLEHPEYEAIEAMVTHRQGRPPLIRVILSLRGGFQIDFYNDEDVARERAAVLTQRLTFYRPIQYEEGEIEGLPTLRVRFTSHRGEDILLDFHGSSAPRAELGGFIDPGPHAGGAALPVMWANASAFASPTTEVLIDGVPYPIGEGPTPGSLSAFYSRGFLIGVFRAGVLKLFQFRHPRRLAVGERWLYWDHTGNLHVYKIIDIAGEWVTVHKTSTSAFLPEELLTARVVDEKLLLQSVRATGRTGLQDTVPPPHEGFILDLSTAGSFSLSIDDHADLVTGTASVQKLGLTTTWRLEPSQPEWATSRTVTASVSRFWNFYVIENSVGEP
ncbi:hypothetical protein F0U61_24260 [Archangium violaceum]|uniref:hypothetical protein n=1 Tax=Archangium violaceum TaxID=83451 RepID=UPI002B2CDE69|nr:hypothetical protein F0U61_24260 [Archangium violaceum]